MPVGSGLATQFGVAEETITNEVQRLSGVPVSNLSSWLLRKMSPNTGNWLAVVNACGYRVVLERDDGAGR